MLNCLNVIKVTYFEKATIILQFPFGWELKLID